MGVVEQFEHEGVEGLRVGRFRIGINSSAIVYRLGGTTVDTGPANQWRFVRRFLQEKPVRRVLITHHHEDHSGNAARIQSEMNAPVFAPSDSLPRLMKGFPMHAYQRFFWGTPRRFRPEPLPEEMELEDGLRLRAVYAAGHAPDMTCFLEPNRGWLFSGDLFIAATTRYLRSDEDFEEILQSLRRILACDFDTVFCAHRGAVPNGRDAIRAKLAGLETLQERARELSGKGKSVRSVTRALVGREGLATRVTRGHFSKRNLVVACLGASDEGIPS